MTRTEWTVAVVAQMTACAINFGLCVWNALAMGQYGAAFGNGVAMVLSGMALYYIPEVD